LIRALLAALAAFSLTAPPAHATMGVTETTLHVQVDGAVRRPGVYALRPGSRVAEAIAAAGGPAPGARLLALNLARAVADGDRCHVPAAGEVPAGAAGRPPDAAGAARRASGRPATGPARRGRWIRAGHRPSAPRARAATPVDLNHATLAELDTLPGVGPAMAARIVATRKKLGGFRDVAQLREVPGIGAKRLAKLRPHVALR
jgi:competence protein ComEA